MTDREPTTTPYKPLIGSTGLNVVGGRIDDEWDRALRGDRRIKTYRQMVDHPSIHAPLFAFESMVRAVGSRVDPADASDEAKAVATSVQHAFDDLDGAWGDTLSDILTCLAYEFSLFAVGYKPLDDPILRIGWDRWSPRAQDTIVEWIFDDQEIATHAVQIAPPSYRRVEIPLQPSPEMPGGCLHFRIRPRLNSPRGTSLLRSAYEPWYFTKHISRIEAIGIERDLTGVVKIETPANITDAERADWQDIGQTIKANEAAFVHVPTDLFQGTNQRQYDVSLMSSPGERSIDTNLILARYERQMFRAFLAGFLTLGDQGVGSYALGSTQADLFITAAKALLEGIQDTINVQGVRRLCAVNGIAPELVPVFRFNEVKQTDTKLFAETMATLIQASVVDPAEPSMRQHIYETIGLPSPEDADDDDAVDDAALPASAPATVDLAGLGAYLVDLKGAGILVETPELIAHAHAVAGLPAPDNAAIERLRADMQANAGEMQATEPRRFVEPDDADAITRARRAWAESVGDEFAGILDAMAEGEG